MFQSNVPDPQYTETIMTIFLCVYMLQALSEIRHYV